MKGNRNRTDLHRQQIFWRRDKVLELSAQDQTEREIAAALQICQGTIHKDIVILKRKAIENIQNYIDKKLPFEYQKCLIGLEAILKKTWEMANTSGSADRDKLQAISLCMEAYHMKLDLLRNAMVIERAVIFVARHRGLINQNTEVVIDWTIEPIENTG